MGSAPLQFQHDANIVRALVTDIDDLGHLRAMMSWAIFDQRALIHTVGNAVDDHATLPVDHLNRIATTQFDGPCPVS